VVVEQEAFFRRDRRRQRKMSFDCDTEVQGATVILGRGNVKDVF